METVNAVGRRKAAIARVIVKEGNGTITINHRPLDVYFPSSILQYVVKQPLNTLDAVEKYDIKVNLDGGGYKGQVRGTPSGYSPRTCQDQPRGQARPSRGRLHDPRSPLSRAQKAGSAQSTQALPVLKTLKESYIGLRSGCIAA